MTKEILIKLRCKAWGITESEYYCNQCSDFSLEDMARAYRRGKNKEFEKVKELEKENAELGQKLVKVQDFLDRDRVEKDKRIAELEKQLAISEHDREHNDYELAEVYKENTELKERIKTLEQIKQEHTDYTIKVEEERTFANEQLTKAKELLKRFIEVSNPVYFEEDRQMAKAEAELFLNSEVEK